MAKRRCHLKFILPFGCLLRFYERWILQINRYRKDVIYQNFKHDLIGRISLLTEPYVLLCYMSFFISGSYLGLRPIIQINQFFRSQPRLPIMSGRKLNNTGFRMESSTFHVSWSVHFLAVKHRQTVKFNWRLPIAPNMTE